MLWVTLMPSRSQSCPFSAAPDRAGHPPPEGWNKIKFDKIAISYCTQQNWRRRTKKSWRPQPWLLNQTLHKIYRLRLQIIRNPATTAKTTKHFRSIMYFALYFWRYCQGWNIYMTYADSRPWCMVTTDSKSLYFILSSPLMLQWTIFLVLMWQRKEHHSECLQESTC